MTHSQPQASPSRPLAWGPDNSLEPTLLAGEKAMLACQLSWRRVEGTMPEPSGGSARGR